MMGAFFYGRKDVRNFAFVHEGLLLFHSFPIPEHRNARLTAEKSFQVEREQSTSTSK